MKKKNIDDVYTQYYLNQAGSGFGSVYAGGVYQKGHGIGSFLSGLFRCVFPLIKSGSAVVGSELLKSGRNIISDISRSENPETVIKKRGKEAINNLSNLIGEKMFGSGYTVAKRKRIQSSSSSRGGKKAKPAKKKSVKKQTKKKKNKKQTENTEKRTKKDIFDNFK